MSSLKQFVFKKEPLIKNGTGSGSGLSATSTNSNTAANKPARKRIRAPASDSSDDDDNSGGTDRGASAAATAAQPAKKPHHHSSDLSPPSVKSTSHSHSHHSSSSHSHSNSSSSSSLTSEEREQRVRKLMAAIESHSSSSSSSSGHSNSAATTNGAGEVNGDRFKSMQETLAKCDWNVERAVKYVRDRRSGSGGHKSGSKTSPSSSSSSSHHHHRTPQKHSSSSNGTSGGSASKTSPSASSSTTSSSTAAATNSSSGHHHSSSGHSHHSSSSSSSKSHNHHGHHHSSSGSGGHSTSHHSSGSNSKDRQRHHSSNHKASVKPIPLAATLSAPQPDLKPRPLAETLTVGQPSAAATTAAAAAPIDKRRRSGSAGANSDNGGADGDSGYRKVKKAVYDSDEDDSDDSTSKRKPAASQSYQMNSERQKVFDFLNDSRPNEFLAVKAFSQKKIDGLCSLRPFTDWRDLIMRVAAHKGLTKDMLNNCQEYLTRRNNLARIMSKCTRMVDRLEKAVADGGGIVQQPSILNSAFRLADYQLIGLNWFAVMHKEDMNGILADEMGLGKTIQVISFLAWLKETGQARGTHLVVVPSSTLDNWAKELATWCPDLKVAMYYGSVDERRQMRSSFVRGGLADVDVLLTTYHIVGSTPEERKMFRVTKIHYVVFDEAHMLKNMTTQRYANLIRINAQRRLLLTGTPLQNNLLELMSLLCFVMPSMFASNTDDIKALFQSNGKAAQVQQPQDGAAGGGEPTNTFEQSQIEQAKRIMRPFVLRRLKSVVLNSLPPKTDHTLCVRMTDDQADYYADCVRGHEELRQAADDELSSMTVMMEMRKLANHPLLLRHYYTDAMLQRVAERLSTHPFYKKNRHVPYVFEELAILSDFQVQQELEKYDVKNMNIPDALILGSGKFTELDRLLPELKAGGHRVLIFSQFTMMLDILERYLDIREHGFLRLDGQTAVTERQELIDQYMGDPELFIFLLSTKAGGLGINLTAADTVIIHDIDFNPYNDKQAEDRCHRMGQKKPVTIYRMLSQGTIEESMRVVAQSKLDLEKEVTSSGGGGGGEEKSGTAAKSEQKCMMRIFTMAMGMARDKGSKAAATAGDSPQKADKTTDKRSSTSGSSKSNKHK